MHHSEETKETRDRYMPYYYAKGDKDLVDIQSPGIVEIRKKLQGILRDKWGKASAWETTWGSNPAQHAAAAQPRNVYAKY